MVGTYGLPVAVEALELILYLKSEGVGIVERHNVQRKGVLRVGKRQLLCKDYVLLQRRVGAEVVDSLVAYVELRNHKLWQAYVAVELLGRKAYDAAKATQIYLAVLCQERRVVVELVVKQQAVVAVAAQLLGGRVVAHKSGVCGEP